MVKYPKNGRGGNRENMDAQGDYKITAYSDPSYIENFINGTSKSNFRFNDYQR